MLKIGHLQTQVTVVFQVTDSETGDCVQQLPQQPVTFTNFTPQAFQEVFNAALKIRGELEKQLPPPDAPVQEVPIPKAKAKKVATNGSKPEEAIIEPEKVEA